MLGLAVALFILASLPVILIYPYVGILVWSWIGFMNPHKLSWGFLSEGAQFAMQVAIVTLAAWMFSREPKRIPATPITVLLAIFTVWFTLTTFTALVPDKAWEYWDKAIKIFLMTFVTIALMGSRERIHALVWVVVISLGFFGVMNGIKTILTGAGSIVWGPPGSFIADNNQLAMAMLMTLPLMRYVQLQSESPLMRGGLLAAMILTFFSVIGSHSRGAFLGLVIVVVMLAMKSRYRLRLGVLLVCFAVAGAVFVPDRWIERMETIENYEEDQSAMGRIRAWTFNYRVALERPILGGGFNIYYNKDLFYRLVPDAPKTANAHSIYFQVLGEHGFIGIFIFLALGILVWRTFGRIRQKTKNLSKLTWAFDLASMAQVSLVAYFISGAFLNLAYFDLYYTIVALSVLLSGVVEKELANHPVSSSDTTEASFVGRKTFRPMGVGNVLQRRTHNPGAAER